MNDLFPEFTGFRYSPALPYEPGITRRDPSPVLRYDGLFYAWYSRSTVDPSGYAASVWYATSPDGFAWTEQGEALPKGAPGTWDEHAVFTPSILAAKNAYYLFYTAVPEPFTNDDGGPGGTNTAIGVARAATPAGPWERVGAEPVLEPSPDLEEFDSHRVDDSCLIYRNGRYWMYYKGRQAGLSPGETKMGVSFADHPEGPYKKYPANPIVDGGHEVCVWPHGAGVAALMAPVGPEGSSLQYSKDGLEFRRIAHVSPPRAPGPYREDRWQDGPGTGISWGLCIADDRGVDRPYLNRFDAGLKV